MARALCTAVLLGLLSPLQAPSQERVDLPALDRPINLNLEPLYSIGGTDAVDWAAFQTLDAAAFGADGQLYLLDRGSARIVATRSGTFSHFVGKEGEGPGEYESPDGLAVLADGTVAVWDSGKRAFLLFDPDGSSLNQVAPDYAAGVPGGPLVHLSGELVLALPVHLVSGRRGAIFMTGDGFESAADGLPLMVVPVRSGAAIEVLARVPTLQGGPVDPATRAFVPQPSWGALEGGLVALATTDRYEVRILSGDGRPVRSLHRPIEARPTTPTDEAAFLRSVRERYQQSLRRSRGLRPVEPSGEVNAHPVIPPIQRITTGTDDKIWIQRPDGRNPMLPGPIDILDTDGAYVGTVTDWALGLPDAFGPDGLVVFLTTGELDVPIARVFRLPERLR